MHRFVKLLLAAALAAPLAAPAAFAHAFLDHAVPGVGLTVSGPVRELRLYFNLGVIAAFSSVQVIRPTGAVISASRPVNDPSDFKPALPPGTYMVTWHVVSTTSDLRHIPFHGLLNTNLAAWHG
jgi:copper resistance protein C